MNHHIIFTQTWHANLFVFCYMVRCVRGSGGELVIQIKNVTTKHDMCFNVCKSIDLSEFEVPLLYFSFAYVCVC